MTQLLNDTLSFSLPQGISITDKGNDYPIIEINNDHAQAEIALYGAHVLHYQPKGHAPVLWVSDTSAFEHGRAVRGGIPLCWPWFGDHPNDKTLPAHGFARTDTFKLTDIEATATGATVVKLHLENNAFNQGFWRNAFSLEVLITVGETLSVTMTMSNKGEEQCVFTSALHSYFAISDVDTATIQGLEKTAFYDKLQGFAIGQQQGSIAIDKEIDQVYLPTSSDVRILDSGLDRTIRIAKSGSDSTVVWNPWIDKSTSMNDFHDGGYRNMVCVETANALTDSITLDHGASHTISTTISVYKGL